MVVVPGFVFGGKKKNLVRAPMERKEAGARAQPQKRKKTETKEESKQTTQPDNQQKKRRKKRNRKKLKTDPKPEIKENNNEKETKKDVEEDEINQVFAKTIKEARLAKKRQHESNRKENKQKRAERKEKKNEAASNDWFNSRSSKSDKRSLTDDGLTVYTEEELKLGQGGDTSLCPFDCECCY